MSIVRTLTCAILATLLPFQAFATPKPKPLRFGVFNQRNATLTAQYWNPILRYVSQRSGVPLRLKLARSGKEHGEMVKRGEFDFLYSYQALAPKGQFVGYRVIARPVEPMIRAQVVVLHDSPFQSLSQLDGLSIACSSPTAFVGFDVPMEAITRSGIHVKTHFAGSHEGAMSQLVARRVEAAIVNSQIATSYAARAQIGYRVLWSSEEFSSVPIAAHPAVPQSQVDAVRHAFLVMASDPEGLRILKASAALVSKDPPYGFTAASGKDFSNVSLFYQKMQSTAARS